MLSFDAVGVRVNGPSGPRAVLDAVSLDVPESQVTVVVGPSGAGKSTLLRLGNRLADPSAGRVLLGGVDVREMPVVRLRRRVGFVSQTPAMWGGSVAENVGYGARLMGASLTRDEVDALLVDVGLSPEFARRVPTELSGGEAQRVALARSFALEPETLLLDEPSSALDPASREGFERLLVGLVRRRGIGALLVTHDMGQARRVGDRAALLVEGKIAADGAPDVVLSSAAASAMMNGNPR